MMDFTQAFTFPFRDQRWLVKLVVVGLILLIPIIGAVFATGWLILIARRVIRGQPEPLVGFEPFVEALVLGLKYLVVSLVYLLPVFLVSLALSLLAGTMQSSSEPSFLLLCLSTCLGMVFLVYFVVLMYFLVAAVGVLADSDRLADAFHLRRLWRHIRNAPAAHVLALLGAFVASLVASLGLVFCLVGGAFTTAYAVAVQGHLYGQAYKVGLQAPLPPLVA
ncbi:MAG: DUF4013 domain-containing protein [Anaerolineales bacterium]|nr:DUF4013 domain-containing protein [Anaerolineales bacterium]